MSPTTLNKIAFICLGNICRSPLAEALLRARADAAGLNLRIDSAGTGAWHIGKPPDVRSIAVAREFGLDISGLRARQIAAADFHRFDLLLCMDQDVTRAVSRIRPPSAPAQVHLMLDWLGLGAGRDVPDPYHGDPSDFLAMYRLLAEATDALVERLRSGD